MDIRAPLNLVLKDILCDEYEHVEAGQNLALLEDYELKHQVEAAQEEVKKAGAALEQAKARLSILESSPRPEELKLAQEGVEQARLKLKVHQAKMERIEGLYAKRYVSQEDLEEAKMYYEIAESEYAEAQTRLELVQRGPTSEELRAASSRVEEAKATYDQAQEALETTQERLSLTVLKAPRDGMIFWIKQRVGYMLQAGDMVMAVAGEEGKLLRVWVREQDAVKVRLGQKVRIESQLYSRRRHWSYGEVIKVDPQGESKRGQQHYEVKVKITEERSPLKFGSSAWAKISVGKRTILDMILGTGERFGSPIERSSEQ
jgi:multidrug resistance efflux pump